MKKTKSKYQGNFVKNLCSMLQQWPDISNLLPSLQVTKLFDQNVYRNWKTINHYGYRASIGFNQIASDTS